MRSSDIAIIADIHGNSGALDAVLADIARRSLATIVNLGDSLFGPLAPAETADRLIDQGISSIRGNQDRVLLSPLGVSSATFAYVAARLSPRHQVWLQGLSPTAEIGDDLFLCHGTPSSDTVYLLEDVREGCVALRAAGDIRVQLAGVGRPVVLCGHSHVPRAVWVRGGAEDAGDARGTLVVNPGSVGLPAYTDEEPWPHAMEAGTPHARYAIMSRCGEEWSVTHVAVPYDWEAAAAMARANDRDDWAAALATGRAQAC